MLPLLPATTAAARRPTARPAPAAPGLPGAPAASYGRQSGAQGLAPALGWARTAVAQLRQLHLTHCSHICWTYDGRDDDGSDDGS